MKFVLNRCHGYFSLSDWVFDQLRAKSDWGIERNDPRLIELVEKFPEKVSYNPSTKIKVIEIPDEATDYELNDYDGIETITYVVDGKIYHA